MAPVTRVITALQCISKTVLYIEDLTRVVISYEIYETH